MKAAVVALVALMMMAASAMVREEKVRFDGHRLVRANVTNSVQRKLIEELELDVWSHESVPQEGLIDVLVPSAAMERVLNRAGIVTEVLIENIQSLIDEQDFQREQRKGKVAFFDEYHVFEEILIYLKQLADQHPSIATYLPGVATSLQGRSIDGIWIHGGPASEQVKNGDISSIPDDVPKIWFNGGQHAREWISPATVMFITEQLLTRYGVDTEVTSLLNQFGFLIVPVINPDGYNWSWSSNRLWRKNRRANAGGSFGVDLNRNWDANWGGQGSSRIPSSDTYCGTAPFSEPETSTLSRTLLAQQNWVAAIDWHSYSQLILRPYGYTTARPPNDQEVALIGEQIRAAIRDTHGMLYTNQPSWQLYYTSGTASDWFYVKANIQVSYTIELRDTGRYGFLLPPAQIIPTGQESFEAVLALGRALAA